MARNQKMVLKGFGHLRCDDFADYLMKMAWKGWHFKEWGVGLVFERGEPEETVYAVEFFPSASQYDTRPEPHTREFAEYCEAAGWKLVDSKGKLCIFKQVRPDAVEILTPEERLENISREELKNAGRNILLPGIYTTMRLIDLFGHRFVGTVFSDEALLITAMWVLLLLAAVTRCVQVFAWRHTARQKLARGEAVRFTRGNTGGWYEHLTLWLVLGMVVGWAMLGRYDALWVAAAMVVPLVILGVLLAKFRPSADTNQMIQIVFSAVLTVAVLTIAVSVIGQNRVETEEPEPPLLYSDIGGTWELRSSDVMYNSSVLGSYLHCFPDYEEGYFYYSVYKSGQGWILDRIWADEMEKKCNQSGVDCTGLWDAETAFQNEQGDYYVRFGDAILILRCEEVLSLTAEQADAIRDKLEVG